MSIFRVEPFEELQKMHREIDRFFEDVLPRRRFR